MQDTKEGKGEGEGREKEELPRGMNMDEEGEAPLR